MPRLEPKIRKEQILDAAIRMSHLHGYAHITRNDVALAAKVSEGTVSLYWGTMAQLRRSIMRHAIQIRDMKIIAQGLAAYDHVAIKAPQELKEKAAASLL